MPFEQTSQKLDLLIRSLENELGEPSVPINPDDPWALYRINNFSVSPNLQVKSCNSCTYLLTLPFEKRCPSCGFKDKNQELFPLLSKEEILAALPKPAPVPAKNNQPQKQKQQQQKQQPKKTEEAPKEAAAPTDAEILEGWGKCQVQVTKIKTVESHPSADSLYVVQLDVGGDQTRQVCAGLVKYYKPEELVDRLVCTMMNLKPKKLLGVNSTAMILAGSANDQVRIVDPPAGSSVGDVLSLEGVGASKSTPKKLSSIIWAKVVSGFKVKDGKAAVAGKTLISEKGTCTVPDLPNGSEIH